MASFLYALLTTTCYVLLVAVAIWAMMWVHLLLHELAHAAVARLVGARVLQGVVGTGARVLPVRWFGARWELRLIPISGRVHFLLPPCGLRRARWILIALAGPVASTALVTLFVWLAIQSVDRALLADLMPLGVVTATFSLAGFALVSWIPSKRPPPSRRRTRHCAAENDFRLALRILRDRTQPDVLQRGYAATAAWHDSMEEFLAGNGSGALAQLARIPAEDLEPFAGDHQRALYTWAAEGARAALSLLDDSDRRFRATRADEPGTGPRVDAAQARDLELLFAINRGFFAAVADDPALLQLADACTTAAFDLEPRNPAVQRSRGFVRIQLGQVTGGLRLLELAWRQEEPPWLRSLCALYLAYGHALRGDARAARRFFAKARRLHPHNLLLADYERRIATALARPHAA